MTWSSKEDTQQPHPKTPEGNDLPPTKPDPAQERFDAFLADTEIPSEISGFWSPILKPVLDTIQAKTIVEVGAAEGHNTANLLKHYGSQSAYLHIIDPQPLFHEKNFRKKFGDTFEIHRDLSLNVLPKLGQYDLIILDGDHNWYTVFNELKQIEAAHQDNLLTYPVIFLHDVAWPYARRDMYYQPEVIPIEYQHGYSQMGIMPGQTELVPVGGLNWQLNNAIYEGGERNGVLTGIEDFIAQSEIDFTFIRIPINFGLGILLTTERWQAETQFRERLTELTSEDNLAFVQTYLNTDLINIALLERSARPYQMDLHSTLNPYVLTSAEAEQPEPLTPPEQKSAPSSKSQAVGTRVEITPPRKPKISVVVVLYNMRREAERTLYSLSSQYQQEVDPADYEVIVVENGSSAPLEDNDLSRFGPNFKYHYLSTTSKSPVHALNVGAQMAQGDIVGLMIDGAHMLTPGVLKYTQLAFQIYANPLVAIRYFCLGPGQQYETIHKKGYNRQAEDTLLEHIGWPQQGYRLFEIGELMVPGKLGWFHPLLESNCLFVKRQVYTDLGGFEERFTLPGGGWANVDFLTRAIEYPDTTLVCVLGEASFHQVHGGTTTNVPMLEVLARNEEYRKEYTAIWGKQFSNSAVPTHYLGHMPPVAVSSFDMVRDREQDGMIKDLRAKDREIEHLAKACDDRLQLIQNLQQTAQERLDLINSLDAELKAKQQLIESLNQELAVKEAALQNRSLSTRAKRFLKG